jgi:fermentation-respiration switch protein FrsA (DUF1100 family)
MDSLQAFCKHHSLANHLLFTPSDPFGNSYGFDYANSRRRLVFIPQYSLVNPLERPTWDGTVVERSSTTGSTQQVSLPSAPLDPQLHQYIPVLFQQSNKGSPFLVIHFHGTGGNIRQSNLWWSDSFTRRGFALSQPQPQSPSGSPKGALPEVVNDSDLNVLSVEYPGYGIFDGKPCEDSLYRVCDDVMRFVLCVLRVPLRNIIIAGRSMGSGPATYVATTAENVDLSRWGLVDADRDESEVSSGNETANRRGVAGLILISPFTSVIGVATTQPGGLLVRSLCHDRFVNADRIPLLRSPFLVIHGRRDPLIPFSHAERLFHLCRSADKEIVEDPSGTHKDVDCDDALLRFCRKIRLQLTASNVSLATVAHRTTSITASSSSSSGAEVSANNLSFTFPAYALDAVEAKRRQQLSKSHYQRRLKYILLSTLLLGIALRRLGCSWSFALQPFALAAVVLPRKHPKVKTLIRVAITLLLLAVVLPVSGYSSGRMTFLEAAVSAGMALSLLR